MTSFYRLAEDDTAPEELVWEVDLITSKWLYHFGFWDRVNDVLGTLFYDLEEDDVTLEAIEVMIRFLDEMRAQYLSNPIMIHRWVGGWSVQPKTLDIVTNEIIAENWELVAGVTGLRAFLAEALREKQMLSVYIRSY